MKLLNLPEFQPQFQAISSMSARPVASLLLVALAALPQQSSAISLRSTSVKVHVPPVDLASVVDASSEDTVDSQTMFTADMGLSSMDLDRLEVQSPLTTKDLKKVEDKVLNMMRSSKKDASIVKTVAGMMEDTMRPAIMGAHNASQAELVALGGAFRGCSCRVGGGLKAAMKQAKKEHEDCRKEEEKLWAPMSRCKTNVEVKSTVKSSACQAKKAVEGNPSLKMDVCRPGPTETWKDWLKNKKSWFSKELARYEMFDEACSRSTRETNTLETSCKPKTAKWTKQREECDKKQATFETAYCNFRSTANQTCAGYGTCFDKAKKSYADRKKKIEKLEKERKDQWKILVRIECLLNSTKAKKTSEADIIKCQQMKFMMSHLTLNYPIEPVKDTCPALGAQQCSKKFIEQYYSKLPPNAQATTCLGKCTPIKVHSPSLPGSANGTNGTACNGTGKYSTKGSNTSNATSCPQANATKASNASANASSNKTGNASNSTGTGKGKKKKAAEVDTCRWRAFGSCDKTTRDPSQDKMCSDKIPKNVAGYCDCNGNGLQDISEETYDCKKTPGTCDDACKIAGPITWATQSWLCVAVPEKIPKSMDIVTLANCKRVSKRQQFVAPQPGAKGGDFQLKSARNLCFDVEGEKPKNGAKIMLRECGGFRTAHQQFTWGVGDANIRWRTYPDKCIRAVTGFTSTHLEIADCSKRASDQKFTVTPP